MADLTPTDPSDDGEIPSWLSTAPSADVPPPVATRQQTLPLNSLRWEDFERLCLRLALLDAEIEDCRQYGIRGQKQHGIDLYGRMKGRSGSYAVYQCKDVVKFSPSDIKKAVDEFRKGYWAPKARVFVLCTAISLAPKKLVRALERQTAVLLETDIQLVPWDLNSISLRLKKTPDLVDDFFGRSWVTEFCGVEAANLLGHRLDRSQRSDFRRELGRLYQRVFTLQDPGLPASTTPADPARPLGERYVVPDIIAVDPDKMDLLPQRHVVERAPRDPNQPPQILPEPPTGHESLSLGRPQRTREAIEAWLCRRRSSVVLGGPGTGKSALLQYIVLDLFSPEPRLAKIAAQWGGLLPVWLPFAHLSRLIENHPHKPPSVSEALQSWLTRYDQSDIWPLVSEAIQDSRLLLVIDGLDEWASEPAGRLGSQLLQNFIESKGIHSIVSSRPSGFQRIPIRLPSCQIGELAPLSHGQRDDLVQKWYRIKAERETGLPGIQDAGERIAKANGSRFILEIAGRPDLDTLSQVPLFLLLLIYLKFQGASLPRRRFEVYAALVNHLVREHPVAKLNAASIAESGAAGLGPIWTQEVFAQVAYSIQTEHPAGALADSELRQIVEEYLTNTQLGLGWSPPEARKHAAAFSDLAEGKLGILVRPAPHELAFFHRSIQEYLAATHATRLAQAQQLEIVRTRAGDPQWRDVILGMIGLTRRPNETAKLLGELRTLGQAQDDIGQSCTELLAEAIFDDAQCPPGLANEIATEVLSTVRDHEFLIYRERLLPHVVEGLRSPRLRDLVASRIDEWLFSSTHVYRPSCFNALSTWPLDDLTIAICKSGMNDEDPTVQRAAIFSLATAGKIAPSVRKLLNSCARKAHDRFRRAAAVEACAAFWPDDEDIQEYVADARASASPVLQFSAIAARVKLGIQDEADKLLLLEMANHYGVLPYQWRYNLIGPLLQGWPRDPDVKRDALKGLTRIRSDRCMDLDMAYDVLLRGYPGDPDVASHLANEFEKEKYPLLSSSRDAWALLVGSFRDNASLVAALDKWISRDDNDITRSRELAFVSGIGRTTAMKEALLVSLEKSFPHWAALGLLDHWGMSDSVVAPALRAFAESDRAPLIGHLIPRILPPAQARTRLLDLLSVPNTPRPDMIVQGLIDLAGDFKDDSLIAAALAAYERDPGSWDRASILSTLIRYAPADFRVRGLALACIGQRESPMSSIVQFYPGDMEIRRKCVRHMSALDSSLRFRLVEEMDRRMGAEDIVSWLGDYDRERDAEIKTRAAIGYCRALQTLGRGDDAVDELRRTMACYGHDHEARRQAAFAGLLVLKREDSLGGVFETIGERRPVTVQAGGFLYENLTLFRAVADRWGELDESCLADIPRRFDSEEEFWQKFAKVAGAYSKAHKAILARIEANVMPATVGVLNFLASVKPRSELLRERCMSVLDQDPPRNGPEVVMQWKARQLFAEHFPDQEACIEAALSLFPGQAAFRRPGLVDALCAVAPGSSTVRDIFGHLRARARPMVPASIFFALTMTCTDGEEFLEFFTQQAVRFRFDEILLKMLGGYLLARLRRDPETRELIERRIDDVACSSVRISLWRSLALTSKQGEDMLVRTREYLRREASSRLSRFGIDVFAGEVRGVAMSLFDTIEDLAVHS